jgi:hypothetical protein
VRTNRCSGPFGRLRLAPVWVLLAAGLGAGPAAGQPESVEATRAEAIRLFEQGLQAFQAADFPAARDAFRASYELRPNASVLFNLANTERALFDYPSALRSFRTYLELFGEDSPPEERTEIDAWLADMEWRVAYVTVDAPAGATVLLDDRLIGTAPLGEPLVVTAESHVVAAVFEGGVPKREVIAPARGARLEVRLTPAEPVAVRPPIDPPPPIDDPPPPIDDPPPPIDDPPPPIDDPPPPIDDPPPPIDDPPIDGDPTDPGASTAESWGSVPLALGVGANLRALDFERRGFADNFYWSVGGGFQFVDWFGVGVELVLPAVDVGCWARFTFLRLSWLRLSGVPGVVATTGALSDRGAGAAVAAGVLAEFRLWEGLTLWVFPTVGLDAMRTVFVAPLTLGVGYWL